MRKYSLDETYFDNIDTSEKAYWLGFIAADGCVQNNERVYCLEIALQKRDRDHLLKFAEHIGSDSPVTPTVQNMRIRLHSRHLMESLANLGIFPRKSLIVEPWDGPLELMPSYWRGLFDGDGCIHKRTKEGRVHWSISIVGSFGCVDGFRKWAYEICGSKACVRKATKVSECWSWAVCGTEKPQLLACELKSVPIGLTRKQDLLEEFCSIDFSEHKSQLNASRAIKMTEAWASGRHARALRR